MKNSKTLDLKDLLHGLNSEGEPEASFTNLIAQFSDDHVDKKLTAELFLKDEFPAVIFCVYNRGEGLFASNTLDEAVAEYNAIN